MKHAFKKFLPFLIFAGSSTVVSAAGSATMKMYFGTKNATESSINANFGSKMSVDDFIGDDAKDVKWLSSGFYDIETHTKYKDNDVFDDQVVSYNPDNKFLTFAGVGSGYVKFISKVDPSITFTKSFESTFRTDCTKDILKKVISKIDLDDVYTNNEISTVVTIYLESTSRYDFSDLIHLNNLHSIVIENKDNKLIKIDNLELKENTFMYVGSLYNEYMERTEPEWAACKNQIYVEKPGDDEVNLLIYKNSGTLAKDDDADKSVQSFLVKKNEATDLLSKTSIVKHGYNFVKYTDYHHTATTIDAETIIEDNIKVIANFNAKNYKITYHIPGETQDVNIVKNCTYDKKEAIFDENDVPKIENRTFAGWSTLKNGLAIEYKPGDYVTNINDGNDTDLYAIYMWDKYNLVFTDDATRNYPYDNIVGEFEQSKLFLKQFENLLRGALIGWNYINLESSAAEIDAKKPIPFIENYSLYSDTEMPTITMHAVYSLTVTCTIMFYCDDITNILNYRIEGIERDDSSFNIGSANLISSDPLFTQKLGYKLVGWRDIQTDIKHLYSDSSSSLTIPEISFGETTYYFEAVYEKNNLKFQFDDEDLLDEPIMTTQYGSALNFNYFYAERVGYEHTGYKFEYTINNNVKISEPVLTEIKGSKVLVNENTINDFYTSIIDKEGVSNQNFESVISTIKIIETNQTVEENHITFDLNGGSWDLETYYTIKYNAFFKDEFNNKKPYKKGYSFKHFECSDSSISLSEISGKRYTYKKDLTFKAIYEEDGCVTGDTKINLISGETINIRDVKLGDFVKTYDFFSGKAVYSQVLYVETSDFEIANIIYLDFDDGTSVGFRTGHVFFDGTLMKYVTILEENVEQFIGHQFAKINYDDEIELHRLTGTRVVEEYIDVCEIVTGNGTVSFNANNYLSSANYTEGLLNLFEINDNFVFDPEDIASNIEKYGLFELSDFESFGITEELFEAFNGQYLKVAIEKGTLDFEWVIYLFEEFLNEN